MSQKLILNGAQAKAVADAMCALNNVGGIAQINLEGCQVMQFHDGSVTVVVHLTNKFEEYPSQGEFFGAYSEFMDEAK